MTNTPRKIAEKMMAAGSDGWYPNGLGILWFQARHGGVGGSSVVIALFLIQNGRCENGWFNM